MLSSPLLLLLWSAAGVLDVTPTPLPASGPGVPSPDVGDPANALLVLMAVGVAVAGIILITVGVRSARANERAEDEAQKRLAQGASTAEPAVLADTDGESQATLPVGE